MTSEPLPAATTGESPSILGFSHVGVCVSDLGRSTRFYCEVLGFRELFTMPMGAELAATMEVAVPDASPIAFTTRMLTRGDLLLELLHWEAPVAGGDGERRPMDRVGGPTHLCFRVEPAALADLPALAARVDAHGGRLHPATLSVLVGRGMGGGDVTVVYLTDPDGTRVELMAGSPDLRGL